MSINVNDKNLGHATAYAYYKAGGGTMTEAEFTEFMADFGTASQTAVEAAQAALASKTAAQTAATTATNKATEATTAATTATTKAAEASTSASTATSAKDTAVSASQTATSKATEATTAAATATSAKTDAVAANTAAQSAKTAAQTAQAGAETAAASVQSSAAQIATNASDISQLKSDLNDKFNLLEYGSSVMPLASFGFDNRYINSSGQIITGDYPTTLASDMVEAVKGANIIFEYTASLPVRSITIYMYDDSDTYKSIVFVPCITGLYRYIMRFSEYTKFRVKIVFTEDTSASDLIGNITISMSDEKDYIKHIDGKNKFNKNDTIAGFYISTNTGTLQPSQSYGVSNYIKVLNNQKLTISPGFRQFLAYDLNLNPINASFINTAQTNYTFTATQDCYVRFSYYASAINTTQAEIGGTVTEYEPYRLIAEENISFLNSVTESEINDMIDNAGLSNVLYGKKWAVCGDSFTNGVLDTTIGTGKYANEHIVYPYLIANRNDMTISKFFANGKTLAYPSDGSFANSLCNPSADDYYQNIPADTDYITIYLGINDSHHENGTGGDGEDPTGIIPLGTIDDTTTATYYGALKTVLQWLITNRPFAHIGMIISNGCDREAYRTAQIEVSRLLGVPYLDLNGDERTPTMIRSQNPNIASGIKWLINNKQAVSYPSNTHPNDNAQIYESCFIENFLRSI